MADDFAELPFGNQQAGPNPAFDLIAWPPAFDVAANRLHDRESGLDHVGATQSSAKLIGNAQLVDGESFLHAFPLSDQVLGAVIMWVAGSFVFLLPATWITFTLLQAPSRRMA